MNPGIFLTSAALAISLTFSITAQAADKDDGPPPAFEKLDIDGDNQISRDEAKLERPLFIHFDAYDADTNNKLSPQEYAGYN